MRVFKRNSICALCIVIVFSLAGSALGKEPSSSLLPEGLIMENIFKPGYGLPLGRVVLVQGKVVIMHAEMSRGYWAKKDLLLFKGDIIVTQKKGRIRLQLNDESIITMASNTKMVINRSVYDRVKKSRFSFLRLTLGKARFWVRKLVDLRRSEFKVKSPTAIVGVRGSGWIEEATKTYTKVTAEKDTKLDVWNPDIPEKPILLKDFEQTNVMLDAPPSDPIEVTPEEIEEMKEDFVITPEAVEPEVKPIVPIKKRGVLISDKELAMPEDPGKPEELAEPIVPDIVEREEIAAQEREFLEQQEVIFEEQHEEAITEVPEEPTTEELPDFPGPP